MSQTAGSVGEVVPMVSAEAATPPAAPAALAPGREARALPIPPRVPEAPKVADVSEAPPSSTTWQAAPPPVRRDPLPIRQRSVEASPRIEAPPEAPKEAPVESTEADDWFPQEVTDRDGAATEGVRELGPGSWQAPPVRGLVPADGFVVATAASAPESPSTHEIAGAKQARRRSRWLATILLLILAGGLGVAAWSAINRQAGNEAELFKTAQREYDDSHFADAAVLFQDLQRDFPGSDQRAHYRFLGELSAVREAVYFPGDKGLDGALGRIGQFLDYHKGESLLKTHEQDIWKTLHKLGKELAEEAAEKKERTLLVRAQVALDMAGRLAVAGTPQNVELLRRARESLAETQKLIVERESRNALVASVKELSEKPSSQSVMLARRLVRQAGRDDDGELKELLQRLLAAHLGQVTYSTETSTGSSKPVAEDEANSILVTHTLGKTAPLALKPASSTVFALARGVLHALDPRDGRVRWARRVGIDNAQLPLRLPAQPFAPELALLLSTDDRTVSAVAAATGEMVWQYVLDEPCTGRPVLVGRLLVVPTYSGRVDEIDVGSGKLLGFFQLGEALTVGAARQEGTPLVFVPAESQSIFVLDVDKHSCERILYSGHARGSLRCLPTLVPGGVPQLILDETDGLTGVKLRSFALPIVHADQPLLLPEIKVRGWTWFTPYQDGERLITATDAGVLGYWGIKQKGNRDAALFPWFKKEVLIGEPGTGRAARAQVVHADAENVWVIAGNGLQRWQIGFHPKDGPQLLPAWSEPLRLGVPLHESQVLRDDAGQTILIVVTQDPRTSACQAQAVQALDGRILWQRQLGIVCQDQPVVVGKHVLVSDSSGVFALPAEEVQGRWHQSGRLLVPAAPKFRTHFEVMSLRGQQSAQVLSFSGPDATLLGIHAVDASGNLAGKPKEQQLPASLRGTPAQGTDVVVLPLANGILERVPLGDGVAVHGPNWRKAGAEEAALGHVVALGGDDFLVTDGSNGLTRLHWSEPKSWEKKASFQVPARILSPPALVADAKEDGKVRSIVVACADDSVQLLDSAGLSVSRSWIMPGKITAGPFANGQGFGCVVGRNRLVWIDPARTEPWEYSFVADIVGMPLWLDDALVVANQAGQFTALRPDTGTPLGAGYALRANVAPATAPVPFGNQMLFAPLTDGTVILFPKKLLR